MNKKRLFIAFPVSQEAEKEMRFAQDKLRGLNPQSKIKWVGDEGFHVTIAFLGDVDENNIENIKKILKNIAKNYLPFIFQLNKVDVFPNLREPKVIVVKIGRGVLQYARKIHDELSNALCNIGLEIENRRWNPHLTLGRDKFGDKIIGFEQVQIKNISWQVDKIELIESELLPNGPKYTILENFSLKIEK